MLRGEGEERARGRKKEEWCAVHTSKKEEMCTMSGARRALSSKKKKKEKKKKKNEKKKKKKKRGKRRRRKETCRTVGRRVVRSARHATRTTRREELHVVHGVECEACVAEEEEAKYMLGGSDTREKDHGAMFWICSKIHARPKIREPKRERPKLHFFESEAQIQH